MNRSLDELNHVNVSCPSSAVASTDNNISNSAAMRKPHHQKSSSSSTPPRGKKVARPPAKGPGAIAATAATLAASGNASIRQYRLQDVLCGRGGKANKHAGNVIFRTIVQRNRDLYQQTALPGHKNMIVVSIIEAIHKHQGRFLRFNSATRTWSVIPLKQAIGKTSQALREQEGRKNNNNNNNTTPDNNSNNNKKATQANTIPTNHNHNHFHPPQAVPSAASVNPALATTHPNTIHSCTSYDRPITVSSSNDININPTTSMFHEQQQQQIPAFGVRSKARLDDDDDDDDDDNDNRSNNSASTSTNDDSQPPAILVPATTTLRNMSSSLECGQDLLLACQSSSAWIPNSIVSMSHHQENNNYNNSISNNNHPYHHHLPPPQGYAVGVAVAILRRPWQIHVGVPLTDAMDYSNSYSNDDNKNHNNNGYKHNGLYGTTSYDTADEEAAVVSTCQNSHYGCTSSPAALSSSSSSSSSFSGEDDDNENDEDHQDEKQRGKHNKGKNSSNNNNVLSTSVSLGCGRGNNQTNNEMELIPFPPGYQVSLSQQFCPSMDDLLQRDDSMGPLNFFPL